MRTQTAAWQIFMVSTQNEVDFHSEKGKFLFNSHLPTFQAETLQRRSLADKSLEICVAIVPVLQGLRISVK